MKTIRNSMLIGLALVLVIAFAALALPALEVQAQAPTPATPAPANPAAPQANGAVAIARLERLYKVEQGVLERQAVDDLGQAAALELGRPEGAQRGLDLL